MQELWREMRKTAALIFDVDGTLAETEEAHRQAFNDTFERFSVEWYWDRYTYKRLLRVAGGKERIRFYATEMRTPLTESDIRALHLQKTARYAELVESGDVGLRIGVKRLIEEAKHCDIKLLIATTTSYSNVVALLDATLGKGSVDIFDAVSAGDTVRFKKPAPDVYQEALSLCGLLPDHCIAVEDSRNGLLAAVSASVTTVVTPTAYTKDECFGEAALVLDHLGEEGTPCSVLMGPEPPEPLLRASWLDQLLPKGR